MIIREWTEKDLAAVAILEHACFEDPWTMDMIKGEFGRMDFCGSIAEEDGKPIGFLCGTLLFEDAEIAKVAVLKEYRGKGYGRQLVEEFFDKVKANGARRIFLECVRLTKRHCTCIKATVSINCACANAIMRTARTLWK